MTSKQNLTWTPASNGVIPDGAFIAGKDLNGRRAYVCRARHESEVIPGHLVEKEQEAVVTWGGNVIPKKDYEVLVAGKVAWAHQIGTTDIPPEAVKGGSTNKEDLYIGRAINGCALIPGKVHPEYGCLFIPSGESEVEVDEFEILVNF